MYKNQYLDPAPTALHQGYSPEKLMKLRNRQPEKELAGEFRFDAKTQLERVYDSMSKNNASGKSPTTLMIESLRKEQKAQLKIKQKTQPPASQ